MTAAIIPLGALEAINTDTANPRHGGPVAAAAFDKLERLLRDATPGLDPFVRADILIAAIDYGHECGMQEIRKMTERMSR